ncbi:fatty acyl-AMP ligase [Spirillospora sp. CA-294931]|uniref:fatty acyl-AMP ligase n=1 Tax=Spirillospora sp. CA-294931 TaxID=3240042 RepID=UPI003D942D9A
MLSEELRIDEPFTALAALRAQEGPDATAFTYVDYSADRHGVARSLSWAELDRRSRDLAAVLVSRGFTPGTRAAILVPQGLDYVVSFLGALHAGLIAVPLFAPGLLGNAARLTGALRDSAPEVWLTTADAAGDVRAIADEGVVPAPAAVLAVDALGPAPSGVELPEVAASDIAYLQYTSGSTRSPAGAVITHANVVANARQALTAVGVRPGDTMVSWLPLFHDMGLVLTIAAPIAGGVGSVFIDPFAFVQRPLRWLRLLAEHPGAVSAAPNFALDLTAERVTPEERRALDLGGVRAVLNGSEPIRAATIERFLATFAESGLRPEALRPAYGLAEATVFVTVSPRDESTRITAFDRDALSTGHAVPVPPGTDAASLYVACGGPVGQEIRIVDPKSSREMPEGDVGEIWVRGPNVAHGYWMGGIRSDDTFGGRVAAPLDDPLAPIDGGWLRTGDLGLLHRGQLYITGRHKDLIIVDGRNHYPQDIEVTAQHAHPAVRRDRVAAFGAVTDGQEGVVVVAEHSRHVAEHERDPGDVAQAVRAAVTAGHDVHLHDFVLVPPGKVPRTSSGKIARAAARTRYLEGGFAAAGEVS